MIPSASRAALVAAFLSVLPLLSPSALASQARYFDVAEPVASGSVLTYRDLALQFAPGLGRMPVAVAELEALRSLTGDADPVDRETVVFGSVERIDLALDGKPALLLLYDLGSAEGSVASVSVLALYDITGRPRLLDALSVGLDRETSFSEKAYMQVSPAIGVAMVRNSHHNAGEEFLQTSFISVRGGKLSEVETVMSMTWLTGVEDIRTVPGVAPVEGATAFDATFDITRTVCDEACQEGGESATTTERVTARYSWDQAQAEFVRPAKALDGIPLPDLEQ